MKSGYLNKGNYVLVINLKKNKKIKVGKLGKISFKKGFYVYVGSAKKNLYQRIKRHIKKIKKKRWHIDYFLSCKETEVEIVLIFFKNKECELANFLKFRSEIIKNFGSTDCKCKSHLFYFKYIKKVLEIINEISIFH